MIVYVFQVTGSNNDGLWNEKPAEVKVTVFPPPWATWWAYAIYLTLISTAIYLYLQYVKDKSLDFCKRQAFKDALEQAVELVSTDKFDNVVSLMKNAVAVGICICTKLL